MNTYLNLSHDDMAITNIIKTHIKKLNANISVLDFKNVIIELDNIDNGGLSEYDEDIICNVQNKLYKKCKYQIDFYMNDTTLLNNNQLFGDFMYFLKHIS